MRSRVATARPDLAAPVGALAARYARLRFGPVAGREEIMALEREVRQLAL